MKNSGQKPRLSPSLLGTLSGGCAYQIEMRERHGPCPPGVAAVVGTASHASVRDDLKNKIETGELLSPEEVADNAASAFDATWGKETPMLDADQAAAPRKTMGSAKDSAVLCSLTHHDELAPLIRPVSVERRLDVELSGFPFDISGYVDVQDERGPRDTKVSKRNDLDPAASIQLDMYSMMLEVTDGARPTEQVLDHIKPNVTPKARVLSAPLPETWQPLLRRIEIAARVLESGALMPADPSHWKCSEKWCGWWSRCEFGQRRRTQA